MHYFGIFWVEFRHKMSIWLTKKKEDPKILREQTTLFLEELENCLKSFEEHNDPIKFKNKLKKSIVHFKLNFYK